VARRAVEAHTMNDAKLVEQEGIILIRHVEE
jgi:hypothetical protein